MSKPRASRLPTNFAALSPRLFSPLVALYNVEGDPTLEWETAALYQQNLSNTWTEEKIQKACKLVFKKGRRGGFTPTVVLECSVELRKAILDKKRVYMGWQAAQVGDYIRVTCCTKCQGYGHPEWYCRADKEVCAKCGKEWPSRDVLLILFVLEEVFSCSRNHQELLFIYAYVIHK